MLTANKTNSIVRSILGILLTAVLLITTQPITAYALDINPEGTSLDGFPALGVSVDTMDENSGTVNTLYSGGIIKDNKGNISSSYGNVWENHGSIEKLLAGHVGTNYGTINSVNNTGSLSVNDKGGKVLFIGMGNVVDRNDGMIQVNAGNVSENYGTVSDNYGTVIMHDGQIVNNYQNGTVTFEAKISGGETIPAKGTMDNNESHVKIYSGTVTIKENTGDIEITNATVTVEKNSGSITVGNNATLICSENKNGGVITKSSESAVITCISNDGRINDETVVMYKIVFIGDDGQAVITECDYEADGVYYTEYEGAVFFTLPPEYVCKSAMKIDTGDLNTWGLNAYPEEGDTEFTIICHKCSAGEYRMNADKHWQQCVECSKALNEGAHTAGGYLLDDNATCIKDGTETYSCAVCGYRHTRTVSDSHLTSDHHEHVVIDQRVEPTETSTGLTQGSHCEDCHKVLIAQEIIPKKPHICVSSSDYLYDGSTHWKICSVCNEKFDEEAHNFTDYKCVDCRYTKPTYTVTFDMNGHGVQEAQQTVAKGNNVVKPANPAAAGYTFKGWYADASVTTVFDFNAAITADTTIYARWVEDSGSIGYTLTFNVGGGSAISSVSGTYGKVIDLDKYVPARAGFNFGGWYSDRTLTSSVDKIKLTGDQNVYAKWLISLPFNDVKETDWSYEDIAYVFENGLMKGTSDTTFAPLVSTSRAMIVMILWRLECRPVVNYAMSFHDVASDQWYTEAIRWAQANGIVSGYSSEQFGTNDPITRDQIAVILYRYADFKSCDMSAKADLSKFTDSDKIDSWATESVAWAHATGLVNGVSATELDPQGSAVREQVAAILRRFFENTVKQIT